MKKRMTLLSLALALVAAGMMVACSSDDPDPKIDKTPTIAVVTPASGPAAGGTAVTITGTYLTGTHAVAFGGALATGVTVVNDTTVTCVTPAHAAGAVEVILATPEGSATRPGGFTYTAPAVTPTAGRWAGGGIKFFVGAGGASITSAGSSLQFPNGQGPCAFILGPISTSCGAATIYADANIPIRSGAFQASGGGLSFGGSFASAGQASGTWSFADPQCGSYRGGWAANWAAARGADGGRGSAGASSVTRPLIDDVTGRQTGVIVYAP